MNDGSQSNLQTVDARESQAQAILNAELRPLAAKWRKHGQKGLELCYEIGDLLKRSLGVPSKRLPYGGKILADVAKTLEAAQSEISRMRWFASLFDSVAAFREKHPELDTWTAFKKALPTLKVQEGQQATLTSKKPTAKAKVARAAKSLAGVNENLSQIENLTEKELENPVASLRKQVTALAERLGLTVTELQS